MTRTNHRNHHHPVDQFTAPGKAAVIIDGQFGSTGKGLIAAYLSQHNDCDVATTNASANAGHTTIDGDRKFVTFHLPTTAVMNKDCLAYLNAGAIIDVPMLLKEIEEVGMDPSRVVIHPRAAVINPADALSEKEASSAQTKLASTQKGVGTALANKILRRSELAGSHEVLTKHFQIKDLDFNGMLDDGARVVVEVPQGFSLGLNSGLAYPYCTSRDVTVAQGLSDACIHPSFLGSVMLNLRTYPIRVGNIVKDGVTVGMSGPCYPDQKELSWEELGIEQELTTVTKRVRRVFTFSEMQFANACQINRPTHIHLNFVNYLHSRDEVDRLTDLMAKIWKAPTHYGFGPDIKQVVNHDEFEDLMTNSLSRAEILRGSR